PPAEGIEPNAIVVAHSGQWVFVRMSEEEHLCLIDERLTAGRATLLAPGDEVYVEFQDGEEPLVRTLAPRRSKLSRLAHAHSRLEEQVIAANVDVLAVVTSALRPRFKPGIVDRYLLAAEAGGVGVLLVVNKMDLVDAEPKAVAPYRDLGLAVVNTSATAGRGIDTLHEALAGKVGVFAGQSGVGKSSLLNALAPHLDIATKEVSASTDKGRHTTSASRLHVLEGGTRLIDTPGIRQLGVWGISPEELAFYFPELSEAAGDCRFRNCTHIHEPDCAVLAAIERGDLPKARYESYLRIRSSLET
ncbi:MAG: ribosome small subunit-dependent GTPase A, partial [Nitrospiraceae bacterium]|nr:ribosome small subunit-dependent GTPase A [Nitrospiraceae bacterium]